VSSIRRIPLVGVALEVMKKFPNGFPSYKENENNFSSAAGTTVRAAIMICDLRDFTRISDNWPRDDVIDLLNDYFDAISEPIARHGWEVLKFMGDGFMP
jgi:class 3 adenylate cyclase